MAGLIQSGMSGKNKNPFGYDPAKRTVDEDQTVLGRISKTLSTDNPLIQQSRTNAAQAANSRGLLNSSIAVGEGEKAAIGAALPIAQQDAATFGQAASENTAAENTSLQFGAGAENPNLAQRTAGEQALEQIGASGTETRKNIETQGTQNLAAIGATGSETRLNIGAQGEQNLAAIGATGEQTRLTQEQGGTIASQLSAQEAGQVQALAQLQGDIQKQLQELQAKSASGLSAQEAAQAKALAQVNGEIESGLITTKEQADARLTELQGQIQSGQIAQQGLIASQLSAQQAGQTQTLAQIQGDIQKQLQELQAKSASGLSAQESAQAEALAQLNGDIQSGLITTQAQAQERLAQVQGQIQSGLSTQQAMQDLQARAAQGDIDARNQLQTQEQANTRLAQLQGQIQAELSAQDAQQRSGQIAQQIAGDMQLQGLRGDQATAVARIEADNRVLIQTSNAAAQFFSQTAASLSAILANPDIGIDQKQQLVDKQVQLLDSGLAVVGGVTNTDLSSLLDFSGGITSAENPLQQPTYPIQGSLQTDMKGNVIGPNGTIFGPNNETNGSWKVSPDGAGLMWVPR